MARRTRVSWAGVTAPLEQVINKVMPVNVMRSKSRRVYAYINGLRNVNGIRRPDTIHKWKQAREYPSLLVGSWA